MQIETQNAEATDRGLLRPGQRIILSDDGDGTPAHVLGVGDELCDQCGSMLYSVSCQHGHFLVCINVIRRVN